MFKKSDFTYSVRSLASGSSVCFGGDESNPEGFQVADEDAAPAKEVPCGDLLTTALDEYP